MIKLRLGNPGEDTEGLMLGEGEVDTEEERAAVGCFHELEGIQPWPPEVEGVRRMILAEIEDTPCLEVINGEYAYWQLDRWVFCAGYTATFENREQ